jgi:hypothetical protein
VGWLGTKCDSPDTVWYWQTNKPKPQVVDLPLVPVQSQLNSQVPSVSGCDAVPFGVYFTTLVTLIVRLSARSTSQLQPLNVKDEGSAIFRSIEKYFHESFRRNLTFSNSAVRTSNSASCRPVSSSFTTGRVTGAPFPSAQASRQGLDGPGIEYQWGRDFPHPLDRP